MKRPLFFIIVLLLLLLYLSINSYGKETSASKRIAFEESKLIFFDIQRCDEKIEDGDCCADIELPKDKIITVLYPNEKRWCEVITGETINKDYFTGTRLINRNCKLKNLVFLGVHDIKVKDYSPLEMKQKKETGEVKYIYQKLIKSKAYKEFLRGIESLPLGHSTSIDNAKIWEYPCPPQVLFIEFPGGEGQWEPAFVFFEEEFHLLGNCASINRAFKLNDKLFFSLNLCAPATDYPGGIAYYELNIKE